MSGSNNSRDEVITEEPKSSPTTDFDAENEQSQDQNDSTTEDCCFYCCNQHTTEPFGQLCSEMFRNWSCLKCWDYLFVSSSETDSGTCCCCCEGCCEAVGGCCEGCDGCGEVFGGCCEGVAGVCSEAAGPCFEILCNVGCVCCGE